MMKARTARADREAGAVVDEELKASEPQHEPVPAGAAQQVAARAALAAVPGRMPAIYLGHGAPPLVDDPLWVIQLAAWAQAMPRPTAVLMVSAHWESAPLTIGATRDGVPLVYDFGGFAEKVLPRAVPGAGRARAGPAGPRPARPRPSRPWTCRTAAWTTARTCR